MQYLLMLYANESGWANTDAGPAATRHGRLHRLHARRCARPARWSARTACSRSSSATTVRVADGKTQVLNGPYAETKEQLGGYYLHRRARPRRGDRVGGALPRRQSRRRRSAAGLGDVGQRARDACREGDAHARDTADAVARRSYGKLVAFLAARTRDVARRRGRAVRGLRGRARRLAGATAARRTRKPGCSPWRAGKLIDASRRRRTGERAARDCSFSPKSSTPRPAASAEIPDHRLR